jgi:hypothetical protein
LDTAASRLSASVDMQGYDGVAFDITIGAMVSTGTLDAYAVEDINSNLATNTNIANAAIVQVPATGNTNVVTIEVWRPTKRYVGVYLKAGTANTTLISVTARQYRGTGTNPPALVAGNQYVVVAEN